MRPTGFATVLLLSTLALGANAQTVVRPEYLSLTVDTASKTRVLDALDDLFAHIEDGTLGDASLGPSHTALTREMLEQLKTPTAGDGEGFRRPPTRQVINIYPVSENRYLLSIAQFDLQAAPHPTIKAILTLVAEQSEAGVSLTLPLAYLTRHWKTKAVGNINYHYRDTLETRRAKRFDAKNTAIAKKLEVRPESFEFFMC